MPKLTKKAEILDTLNRLITKEAELAQTNVSGEPCKDTKVTSISESTETTDKNGVGADKQNSEQGYKQEDAKDKSEPVATAKSAEDNSSAINKLAADILSTIKTATEKAALAQTGITGKPCADTKVESVSDDTETTDKNAVGADKQNKEQGYEQKDSKDKSKPVATAKSASATDLEKDASYKLGLIFTETLLKKASEIKTVKEKTAEDEMLKEAGRRDFDTLIAQAAAELEQQQTVEAEQEKQAEYQGAVAFDELLKQAQFEAVVEENNTLRTKLAAYAEHERIVKEASDKAANVQRESELAAKVASIVIETLKRESVPTATK